MGTLPEVAPAVAPFFRGGGPSILGASPDAHGFAWYSPPVLVVQCTGGAHGRTLFVQGPTAMATASKTETGTGADGPPHEAGPSESLDRRTREIGRELFDRIGRGRRPWRRGWWDDRFMALTLDDPLVRVQLFRFIDALPALEGCRIDPAAPGRVSRRGRRSRPLVAEAGAARWRPRARRGRSGWPGRPGSAAGVMARKFIAGATPDEALADRPGACGGAGWPSRPTCSARPSSARPRPTGTSRPASTMIRRAGRPAVASRPRSP